MVFTNTQKKELQFANLIRSYRKKHVGKGPEDINVTFKDNWAIAHMGGTLSKVENFYMRGKEAFSMLRNARTESIKALYNEVRPIDMEELVGAKFEKLFTDVDLENDEVISVFVFDKSID